MMIGTFACLYNAGTLSAGMMTVNDRGVCNATNRWGIKYWSTYRQLKHNITLGPNQQE